MPKESEGAIAMDCQDCKYYNRGCCDKWVEPLTDTKPCEAFEGKIEHTTKG